MVGTVSYAAEGDMIQATGRMTEHPVYGEQLQIESYELKNPEDAASMERYLGSGAIKGVGAALAARIVRRFKADTFRIMEEEPERLQEHIQDTCFYPVIGICENSHFPGYFVCHFKANARNIVRQTIGIFLDNAVQLRAIFLINFSSQITG